MQKNERLYRIVSHLCPDQQHHSSDNNNERNKKNNYLLEINRVNGKFSQQDNKQRQSLNKELFQENNLNPIQTITKSLSLLKQIYQTIEMIDEEELNQQELIEENEEEIINKKEESSSFIDRFLYRLLIGGNEEREIGDINDVIVPSLRRIKVVEEEKKSTIASYDDEDDFTIDRPITASVFVTFIETILNTTKALSIITLVTVTYLHEKFIVILKPILIIEFARLEKNLRKLLKLYKEKLQKYKIQKYFIKHLKFLQYKSPKLFKRILILYNNYQQILSTLQNNNIKSWIYNLYTFILSIYFNILFFIIYLFEKVTSPRLLYLLSLSHENLLELCERVILFVKEGLMINTLENSLKSSNNNGSLLSSLVRKRTSIPKEHYKITGKHDN
ncbi:hypothetical protein ABK040_001138 [Willaertia magna]